MKNNPAFNTIKKISDNTLKKTLSHIEEHFLQKIETSIEGLAYYITEEKDTNNRALIKKDSDFNIQKNQTISLKNSSSESTADNILNPIITVENIDVIKAIQRAIKLGFDNPFVVDLANKDHVGGGVVHGATAQEEVICRYSTLYAVLATLGQLHHDKSRHPQLQYRHKIPELGSVYAPDIIFSGDFNSQGRSVNTFKNTCSAAVIAVAGYNLTKINANADPKSGSYNPGNFDYLFSRINPTLLTTSPTVDPSLKYKINFYINENKKLFVSITHRPEIIGKEETIPVEEILSDKNHPLARKAVKEIENLKKLVEEKKVENLNISISEHLSNKTLNVIFSFSKTLESYYTEKDMLQAFYKSQDEGFALFREKTKTKIRHTLDVAVANKHRSLILGALSCGAFAYDHTSVTVQHVAEAYREVLSEPQYKGKFDYINFAVLDRSKNLTNFKTFQREISELNKKNATYIDLFNNCRIIPNRKTHQNVTKTESVECCEITIPPNPKKQSEENEKTQAIKKLLIANHITILEERNYNGAYRIKVPAKHFVRLAVAAENRLIQSETLASITNSANNLNLTWIFKRPRDLTIKNSMEGLAKEQAPYTTDKEIYFKIKIDSTLNKKEKSFLLKVLDSDEKNVPENKCSTTGKKMIGTKDYTFAINLKKIFDQQSEPLSIRQTTDDNATTNNLATSKQETTQGTTIQHSKSTSNKGTTPSLFQKKSNTPTIPTGNQTPTNKKNQTNNGPQ